MKKHTILILKILALIAFGFGLTLTKLLPQEIIVLSYIGVLILFKIHHKTTLTFLMVVIAIKYLLLLIGQNENFFIQNTNILYLAILAIAQKIQKEGALTFLCFGFIALLTLLELDSAAEKVGIYLYYLLIILAISYTKPIIIKEWSNK